MIWLEKRCSMMSLSTREKTCLGRSYWTTTTTTLLLLLLLLYTLSSPKGDIPISFSLFELADKLNLSLDIFHLFRECASKSPHSFLDDSSTIASKPPNFM
jgi:hypothetical protein